MFVSQERGATRKQFQKPNILRRKSKVVRLQKNNESPEIMSLLSTTNNTLHLTSSSDHVKSAEQECNESFQIIEVPQFSVVDINDKNLFETSETLEINGNSMTIFAHNDQEGDNDVRIPHNTLNVESFLTDGLIEQNEHMPSNDTASSIQMNSISKQKWCLEFMSEDSKDIVSINCYDESHTQPSSIYMDNNSDNGRDEAAVVSLLTYDTNSQQHDVSTPVQNVLDSGPEVNQNSGPVKFKCDVPNCNKTFWMEARLQKHKNAHKNQKEKTPTKFTCPVKKKDADGKEVKCDQTFPVRNQLMAHLNEDHSPEDALYRCEACDRRFFWAGGARAHQAGACDREFACRWAGCNRVFRQPCRLREHARAHTGDRPYACHYPNCGWAFRSASKLVRHARRHTGERRHACGACGRAFLRREHLRDHVARHHSRDAPTAPRHACTYDGCEQTFKSMSSLVMHLKKVHNMKNEGKPSTQKRAQKNSKVKKETSMVPQDDTQKQNLFSIDLQTSATDVNENTKEPTEAMSTEDDAGTECDVAEQEGRCARTHCTWPLQRPSDFSVEEDDQVEQSESSESNIYMVRSDLFLHGNVLINEDSEFVRIGGSVAGAGMAEGEEGERDDEGNVGESLGLIDPHPTIDLMQEELLYADAVDESSFRVFLLNGEELS